MKATTSRQSIDATLKEFCAIIACLERCTNRLRELLPALAKAPAERRLPAITCSRPVQAGDFDRYRWGCTVVASLAPTFDSREFSRSFRAALPPEVLRVLDPVRLKKILQRLCREKVIAMTKAGRGRTPAHYQVLSRPKGNGSLSP